MSNSPKLYSADAFKKPLDPLPPVVKADLKGKTVIVIGANTGLGFEAAKHFASMGPARLILGCRSATKGHEALKKLQSETGYERAELWIIDLSSFASVREFADKAIKELDRIDLLVENAAAVSSEYEITQDGWQSMLEVNNLAPELLALLLLPKMVETAKISIGSPRLVVVSSGGHALASLNMSFVDSSENIWKNLSTESHWNSAPIEPMFQSNSVFHYHQVKLFNVLFVLALQKRLVNSSIIANTINPGFCVSELRRGMNEEVRKQMKALEEAHAYSTEEGSRSIVYGAVGGSEDETNLKGAYLSLSTKTEPSDFVLSDDGKKAEDKLWNDMVQILVEVDPRVGQIVQKYLSA